MWTAEVSRGATNRSTLIDASCVSCVVIVMLIEQCDNFGLLLLCIVAGVCFFVLVDVDCVCFCLECVWVVRCKVSGFIQLW